MKITEIAQKIPSDIRQRIVLDWIPKARPHLGSPEFKMLWETYFTYVDPNGIPKADCPICLANVLDNWKAMQKVIAEVEQDYQALFKL